MPYKKYNSADAECTYSGLLVLGFLLRFRYNERPGGLLPAGDGEPHGGQLGAGVRTLRLGHSVPRPAVEVVI